MIHNSYCILICANNLFFSSLANKLNNNEEQNNFILGQTWLILKHHLIPVFNARYIYKQNIILETKKHFV